MTRRQRCSLLPDDVLKVQDGHSYSLKRFTGLVAITHLEVDEIPSVLAFWDLLKDRKGSAF